jgi:hypothetical protein
VFCFQKPNRDPPTKSALRVSQNPRRPHVCRNLLVFSYPFFFKKVLSLVQGNKMVKGVLCLCLIGSAVAVVLVEPTTTPTPITTTPTPITIYRRQQESNAPLRVAACQSDDCCCLEIQYSGSWGTICNDDWKDANTRVACRQMGCGGTVSHRTVGGGSGRIWLDGVDCAGTEASLSSCDVPDWDIHNCEHDEDVGVCSSSSSSKVLGPLYLALSLSVITQ